MKFFRNRLLVPLVLTAVLSAALGASANAAILRSMRPHPTHAPTSGGSTLKPGAGPMSGEPDASNGTGLPKVTPTGAAQPTDPSWWMMVMINVTTDIYGRIIKTQG